MANILWPVLSSESPRVPITAQSQSQSTIHSSQIVSNVVLSSLLLYNNSDYEMKINVISTEKSEYWQQRSQYCVLTSSDVHLCKATKAQNLKPKFDSFDTFCECLSSVRQTNSVLT